MQPSYAQRYQGVPLAKDIFDEIASITGGKVQTIDAKDEESIVDTVCATALEDIDGAAMQDYLVVLQVSISGCCVDTTTPRYQECNIWLYPVLITVMLGLGMVVFRDDLVKSN